MSKPTALVHSTNHYINYMYVYCQLLTIDTNRSQLSVKLINLDNNADKLATRQVGTKYWTTVFYNYRSIPVNCIIKALIFSKL